MKLFAAWTAALWLPLLMLLATGTASVRAGDGHEHDRAREAVEAGEILSLKAILERVERTQPGQVMDVDLERRGGRWIYEIKLLRPGGAMSKLMVDARDASVIEPKAPQPEPAAASRQPGALP
jgi:uncharacterized membrane protein YkoI